MSHTTEPLAVKEQGQGKRCVCSHHRLYHSSWGNCMVLNCSCKEYREKEEEKHD